MGQLITTSVRATTITRQAGMYRLKVRTMRKNMRFPILIVLCIYK